MKIINGRRYNKIYKDILKRIPLRKYFEGFFSLIFSFSKLIKALKEKLSLKIVVIAAKGEEQFAKKVVEENEVIDLRGKLSVAELGALFKRTSLFISNDSGPVHIAASLGTAVISIFGRKNPGLSPKRWVPIGANCFYFHKDAGCKICLAHRCKRGFLCLKAITPDEVLDKSVSICKSNMGCDS